MDSAWQRLCLSDSVALKFLEDDPAVRTVERRQTLSGYELHLVEQWACSREDPTIAITTFTGQPEHKILVSIIEVPTAEESWSPKLRFILKRFSSHHHARKQNIPGVGSIFVTNLSTFPSILTIVPIPTGDLRGHRVLFFVNENLKRMGCSGRSGLNLAAPSVTTNTKFRQVYRVASEQVVVNEAVLELVQMCQIALVMFEKLRQEYCDGLLCDYTERGLADWWTEIGLKYYNVEPSDGILGPSTVAALLGLFLGARNRLNVWGAPVAKDAFDIQSLKRGIAHFQKARNLPRTRRLDRDTLHQLHKHTAKAASHEGWAVPRAVKSTVAELGKGGEMMLGMVGSKDKVGIAEVETTEIEQFVDKLKGERCKWLWRGKPRKHLFRAMTQEHFIGDHPIGDESGGYVWENSSSEDENTSKPRHSAEGVYEPGTNPSKTSLQSADRDQAARKTVLKTVTGRMTDARAGLGRFRDAVGTGLRGHGPKASRDVNTQEMASPIGRDSVESSHRRTHTSTKINDKRSHQRAGGEFAGGKPSLEIPREQSKQDPRTTADGKADQSLARSPAGSDDEQRHFPSTSNEEDMDKNKARVKRQIYLPAIQRSKSVDVLVTSDYVARPKTEGINMRNVSFTDLPALSRHFATPFMDQTALTPVAALELEQYRYVQSDHLHSVLLNLKSRYPKYAQSKVGDLKQIGSEAHDMRERISAAHKERIESSQSGTKLTEEAVQEARDLLTGRLQEIEALGAKLEYELGALASKIEDVEDGVTDLDRQVQDLESRSRSLAQESREQSWHHWVENVARRLRIV